MEWNEQDFLQKYRGMEKYLTEGRKYYDLFKALLPKTELLEKIKFANDVLGVPSLKTFIYYEREYLGKDVFQEPMTKAEKQGLGASFGYLYRFIYGGYEPEQCWVNDGKTGIKTASYFKKVRGNNAKRESVDRAFNDVFERN